MTRLAPWIIAALAVALSVAAGWGGYQWKRAADLHGQLQVERIARLSAQAALERAREANRVHRAYLDRAAEDRAQRAALARRLAEMEGSDAPLTGYLADGAGLVWPD